MSRVQFPTLLNFAIKLFLSAKLCLWFRFKQKKTNSVAFSPRANYTDCATATCRRKLVPTFVDRGVSRGQRGGSLTVVNLSFLDRSLYFSGFNSNTNKNEYQWIFLGFQGSWSLRKPCGPTAICEPNVETMWDTQTLMILRSYKACYVSLLFLVPGLMPSML
jgi:hypothetical protein